VCAFMWAGSHHINVTNNSYFADPWLFTAGTTPSSAPSWKAEQTVHPLCNVTGSDSGFDRVGTRTLIFPKQK